MNRGVVVKNYTFINKKQYEIENNDSVSLLEHAIFESTNNEKFALLKFINHHPRPLKELEVEVTQFNDANDIIKKSVYEFNEINVKSQDLFIPSVKIQLDSHCVKFECQVIHSQYESNDQTSDIEPIDIEPLPLKKLKVGRRWATLPLLVVLSSLLIYLVSVNLHNFQVEHIKAHLEFDYMVNRDNTITITRYNGTDFHVTIPSYYDDRKVTKIDDGAFKNSLVQSVTINATEIEIGDEAFANAFLLKSVTGQSITTIGENSFKNNFLLDTFQFGRIERIKTGAFYNAKSLKTLEVNEISSIDYQALYKSGLDDYRHVDGLEIYNNVLMNVGHKLKSITISEKHNIHAISKNAFENSRHSLEELIIDTKDITFDKEVFVNLRNIRSIKLHPELKLPNETLYHLHRTLEQIEMPVMGDTFTDIIGTSDHHITKVTIVGTRPVPRSYFKWCSTFNEIYINSSVEDVEENAFGQCDNLSRLSIPNYEKRLSELGTFPYLKELNVLEKEFNMNLVDHFIDGFEYLTYVTFPENITRTGNNVIINAPSLREVKFPASIEAIDGTLIGENCFSLVRLVIPFIGRDVLRPMRYTELNRSYEYTREVVVLKDTTMGEETFDSPSLNIESLTFNGELKGDYVGSLKNLNHLKHLELKQSNIKYIGSLFTKSAVNKENDATYWPKDLTSVTVKGKKVK